MSKKSRRAKVFWTGRSQAVRLPKEFRFDTDTVLVRREGDAVVLEPATNVAGVTRGMKNQLAGFFDLRDLVGSEYLGEIHAKRRLARGIGQVMKEMIVVPRSVIDVAAEQTVGG